MKKKKSIKFFSYPLDKKTKILKDLFKDDLRKVNINKFNKIEKMTELEKEKNKYILSEIYQHIPFQFKKLAKKIEETKLQSHFI